MCNAQYSYISPHFSEAHAEELTMLMPPMGQYHQLQVGHYGRFPALQKARLI